MPAYPDGTWSWAFTLAPLPGGRTRLVTRNRMPVRRLADRWRLELMLPGAFLMMRKMLLGIKARVEGKYGHGTTGQPGRLVA